MNKIFKSHTPMYVLKDAQAKNTTKMIKWRFNGIGCLHWKMRSFFFQVGIIHSPGFCIIKIMNRYSQKIHNSYKIIYAMGIINIAYMSKNNPLSPTITRFWDKIFILPFWIKYIEILSGNILLFKKLPDVVVETFCAFRSLFEISRKDCFFSFFFFTFQNVLTVP